MVKKQKTLKHSTNLKNQNIIQSNNKAKINTRDLLEKQKVKVNSKMKKKLKTTFKKLQFNEDNLVNSIKAIKLQNEEKNKKPIESEYENIYLYILLKNQIQKQEKTEFDIETSENLKKLKNKIIKLPCDLINEENQLKIGLIVEDEKEQKNLEESLKLTEEEEENLEILSLNDFSQFVKSLKTEKKSVNINSIYHMIIASDKIKNRINQILNTSTKRSSQVDTIYYKQQKSLNDFLQNLISLSAKSSLLKVVNTNKSTNVFKIKIANTAMKNSEVYKNVKTSLYRIVSLILASLTKYTAVKAVVLKSQSSLPFEIYEKIDEEDLEIFEN
jgi:hypothetical protein